MIGDDQHRSIASDTARSVHPQIEQSTYLAMIPTRQSARTTRAQTDKQPLGGHQRQSKEYKCEQQNACAYGIVQSQIKRLIAASVSAVLHIAQVYAPQAYNPDHAPRALANVQSLHCEIR